MELAITFIDVAAITVCAICVACAVATAIYILKEFGKDS